MQTETPQTPTGTIALSDLPTAVLEQLLAERKAKENAQKPREQYKTQVAQTLPELIGILTEASDQLTHAKLAVFEKCKALLTLKYAAFGIKKSRSKHSHLEQQTHTFADDEIGSVTIGFRILEHWDDTADTGIDKITGFLQSLSTDGQTGALVELVFKLLRKNQKGNIKASSLVQLQNMVDKFNSPEFTDGVSILEQAFKPIKSSWFIEAYTKNGIGEKAGIPLSIATVEFPADFVFEFGGEPAATE
ncbi:MAG: hypothetical protein WAW36_01060 [Methylovulum miyakonense]|uniref:hypothetical protein n=1 Tax=Methylovulum miyakonense TaxID=645578 RepID=UPI003BB752B7